MTMANARVFLGLEKLKPSGTDREIRLAHVLWRMTGIALLVLTLFILQAQFITGYMTRAGQYYLPAFAVHLVVTRLAIQAGRLNLAIPLIAIGLGGLYTVIAYFSGTAFHLQVMSLCMGLTIATIAGKEGLGLKVFLSYTALLLTATYLLDPPGNIFLGVAMPQSRAGVAIAMLACFYSVTDIFRKHLLEHEAVALGERDLALERLKKTNAHLEQLLLTTENELDTSRQVTQRIRIEKERLVQIDQMMAGLSHALGSPLGTAMMMAANLTKWSGRMLQWHLLNENQRSSLISRMAEAGLMVERNVGEANKLLSTLNEISTSQFQDELRVVSVTKVVEHAILNLRSEGQIGKSQLKVDLSVPSNVVTYRETLERVIRKVLHNAEVHAFHKRDHGQISVGIQEVPKSGMCQIVLMDDGWGMEEGVIERAFDPFFTTRRSDGHIGMGLTTAQHLVKSILGGRMYIQSSPGQGTKVFIDLPLRTPAIEVRSFTESTQPAPLTP